MVYSCSSCSSCIDRFRGRGLHHPLRSHRVLHRRLLLSPNTRGRVGSLRDRRYDQVRLWVNLKFQKVPGTVFSLLAHPPNTISVEPSIVAAPGGTTGEAEIRLIALARLALPPTTHIRAHWTRLSDAIAQVALRFGADELTGFPKTLIAAKS